MTNAAENRFAAIRKLMDKYIDSTGELIATDDDREKICDEILELRAMGRSDRWKNACASWYFLVKDMENELRWALVQGHMYCIWEAK